MAGLSDYAEELFYNWMYEGAAMPAAPTVRIALSTTAPNDDGTNVTEPSGAAGYARQNLSMAAGSQGADAFSGASDAEVTFGPATANWGSITHWATYDAATGGNMLKSGALNDPRTVNDADSARFAVGAFTGLFQ